MFFILVIMSQTVALQQIRRKSISFSRLIGYAIVLGLVVSIAYVYMT